MKGTLITIAILALIYVGYRTYRIMTLDKGLDSMIEKGAIILDVRTVAEFETGHIRGAINIPLSRLLTDSLPFDKNKAIITCCSHGLRSVKAVEKLKSRGYSNSFNGGAWNDLEASIKIDITGKRNYPEGLPIFVQLNFTSYGLQP